MKKLVLHNYFRSSASFRVRIALNLKKLPFEYKPYHLRKNEQRSEAFLKLNEQGLVPALELPTGVVLTQSLAIIEYLEEIKPAAALLPADPIDRAFVREIADTIAMDLHPINNLRVLARLRSTYSANEEAVTAWVQHWVRESFSALESKLQKSNKRGEFCFGDSPGLADICLVPQCFNNKRFGVEVSDYPTIARIFDRCMVEAPFRDAQPTAQPDNEP